MATGFSPNLQMGGVNSKVMVGRDRHGSERNYCSFIRKQSTTSLKSLLLWPHLKVTFIKNGKLNENKNFIQLK